MLFRSIAHENALQVYRHAASLPGLKVVGIDCHIGSQITEVTPYLDAMDRVLDLVDAIEAAGIRTPRTVMVAGRIVHRAEA